MGRVVEIEEAKRLRVRASGDGLVVVLTNGYFDVLHIGHVRYLQGARAQGDLLFVGLNADSTARRAKDPRRPIVPEAERAELLTALACVDYVVGFDEDTAERLVEALRPDIYAKGGDYAQGGASLPEARSVEAYGGRVTILPFHADHSTTSIIETIVRRYCPSGNPLAPMGQG